MNPKIANRYVDLLSYIIDREVRIKGRDTTFDKNSIKIALGGDVSEKVYKQMIKWFKEKFIFDTVGNTFGMKYKLHSNFRFKMSKKRETIIKQCQFIIGQLSVFDDKLYDEAIDLYKDVIEVEGLFDFLTTIKSKKVTDTVSTLLLHSYNKGYDGCYTYELLQTLLHSKTPFEIKIKDKNQFNLSMKDVVLKKVVFNFDTVTLTFNNSKFDVKSIDTIKSINIPIPKDIYQRIDESIAYLSSDESTQSKALLQLLNGYKTQNEIFFQSLI